MGKVFFVLTVMLFFAFSARAGECSSLVGSCEYYQCVENREHCGSKGYYIKFGQHYCEKYQKSEPSYSQQGQEFLVSIRTCLQDELERERIKSNELPQCDKVEKFAVATHKYCYQKHGFCELSFAERTKVKFTAKKELFHPQMLLFGLWLEKACL